MKYNENIKRLWNIKTNFQETLGQVDVKLPFHFSENIYFELIVHNSRVLLWITSAHMKCAYHNLFTFPFVYNENPWIITIIIVVE